MRQRRMKKINNKIIIKKNTHLFARLRLEPATNVEISFSLCLLPHWNWVLQNNKVGTSPNKKRMIVFLLVIEL